MINRILIRVKVVQMLYSYLLTQSDFYIEPAPELPSADKRFAYTAYIDLLLAIVELSGISTSRGRTAPALVVDKLLKNNRVGAALAAADRLKTAISRGNSDIDVLRPLLQAVADDVAASEAFKDFKKKKTRTPADEGMLWSIVVETILLKNPDVAAAMRSIEGYTGKGLDMGLAMVKKSLADFGESRQSYINARADLQKSLDKAYDLYFGIFELIVEITRQQRARLDAAKEKYMPTAADLNPSLRFVDNTLVARLEADEQLLQRMADQPSHWSDDISLVPRLLDEILASDIYARYMDASKADYAADCEFWREVCKTIILPSDALAEVLESRSVFWNDDMQVMGTFVLKTLRRMASTPADMPLEFLPKYKDDEDAAFGDELFTTAVAHRDEYRAFIDRFINSEQWDTERIAFMDIVVMTCAIAELINYPAIPVPVTMNEYVEIANSYSSPRSGQFVNGVLYAVCEYLRSQGVINK